MRNITERHKKLAWLSTFLLGLTSSFIGSLIFPKTVYTGFIWKYFWGPVVADAFGLQQVERINGRLHLESTGISDAVTAEPGYTTISTVVYAVILVYMIAGLVLFSDKLSVKLEKKTFLGLVPFMILGGLLRVAEDINTIIYSTTGSFAVPFPYSTLFISPFIYGTLFVLSLLALYASIKAEEQNIVKSYHTILAGIGTLMVLFVIAGILIMSVTYEFLTLNYTALFVTLLLSMVLSLGVYYLLDKFLENINEGTGVLGIVVLWAHSLDGVVNVISLDWSDAIGLGVEYQPKHVINSLVRRITSEIQPQVLSDLIGVTWPFIFLKIGVAVFLIWTFDEQFEQDNKRLFILLLLAATAVGLGPGTRDLVRIVLGV